MTNKYLTKIAENKEYPKNTGMEDPSKTGKVFGVLGGVGGALVGSQGGNRGAAIGAGVGALGLGALGHIAQSSYNKDANKMMEKVRAGQASGEGDDHLRKHISRFVEPRTATDPLNKKFTYGGNIASGAIIGGSAGAAIHYGKSMGTKMGKGALIGSAVGGTLGYGLGHLEHKSNMARRNKLVSGFEEHLGLSKKASDSRGKDAAIGAGVGAGAAAGGTALFQLGKMKGMVDSDELHSTVHTRKTNQMNDLIRGRHTPSHTGDAYIKGLSQQYSGGRSLVGEEFEKAKRLLPKKIGAAAALGLVGGGAIGALAHGKGVEKQAGWDTVGRIIKRVGNTLGAKPGLRRGQMGPAAPKGFGDKVRGFGQDVLNDKGHARLAVGATGAALATGVVGGRLSKSNEPQQ